jgi:excisionase family DNA binding protein
MENKREDPFQTYTLNDLMRILQLSRRSIYNYIRQKKLRAYKLAGSYRVSVEQLQSFLAKMESGAPNK